jgi:hypothetical protein
VTVAGTAEPVDLGSVHAPAGVAPRIAIGPTGTSLLSAGMLYVGSSTSSRMEDGRVPRANRRGHLPRLPGRSRAADEAPAMYLGPDGMALWTSLDDGKTWSSAASGDPTLRAGTPSVRVLGATTVADPRDGSRPVSSKPHTRQNP